MPSLIPFTFLLLFFCGMWLVYYFLLPVIFRATAVLQKRVSRWTLARPFWKRLVPLSSRLPRAYFPVVTILAAGIILSMIGGWAFLELAEAMGEQDPRLRAADNQVYAWARDLRQTAVTPLFIAFTIAGTPVGLGIIATIVGIIMLFQRRYRWVGYLAVTAIGGGLLNVLLKDIFARSRPDLAVALRQAHGYSFPSGHAMGSIVVMGALSYLAVRSTPNWKWRSTALSIATSFVLLVSFSRIYLGVHWVSDIGAGLTAGAIWVIATTLGYEVLRRIRALRGGRDTPDTQAITTEAR